MALHAEEIEEVLKWNASYKNFFTTPSLTKLINLYKFPEYRETTKMRVRIWNIAVALKIDDLIIKLIIGNGK